MKNLLSLLALAAVGGAQASLIAADDFSDTTPTLGFAAPWASYGGSGIGFSTDSPLLPGAGRYATTSPNTGAFVDFDGTAAAGVDAALNSAEGLWFGYAGRWTGEGGDGRFAGVSLALGGEGQFYAGIPYNRGGLGVDLYNAIAETSVAPVSGRTYRLEANLRNNGEYAFYLNGALALSGTRSGGFASLTRIYLGAGGSGLTVEADEIRLGTTRADVQAVPEPASLAALGLGGLGLLRRRRR